MRIDLHIERLVLDASLLGAERVAAVRSAIEIELARQLAAPGAAVALRGIGSVANLPRGSMPASRHANDRLGPRIAGAVSQTLGVDGPDSTHAHRHRRATWQNQK